MSFISYIFQITHKMEKKAEGNQPDHNLILDMFNSEPVGMSFDSCENDSDSIDSENNENESDREEGERSDSNRKEGERSDRNRKEGERSDSSSSSSSSSEFHLAENCEVSERVMLALKDTN